MFPCTRLQRLIVVSVLCIAGAAAAEPITTKWWNQIQIYGMVPVPVAQAKAHGYTVNGLWAGFFNTSAVVPPARFSPMLHEEYQGKDAAYVQAMHDEGLKVPAVIPGIAGHEAILNAWPELQNAVCRTAEGEVALFDPDPDSQVPHMCGNDPAWFDWQLAQAKRALDAGADLIVVDEIQGNALGVYGSLCCEDCQAAFKAYLKNRYTAQELEAKLGLKSLDAFSPKDIVLADGLHTFLTGEADFTYAERIADKPLAAEYWQFQEQANFENKRRLFESIRDYGASKGRYVPIGTNTTLLSAFNLNGFWLKGLPYLAFADLGVYENTADPNLGINPPFPQGKWVAWEKLGYAVNGARNVILPNVPTAGFINTQHEQGHPQANYTYILMAEAYANNAATVLYAFEGDTGPWTECARLSQFLRAHAECYDAPSEPFADLAIVFLYGEGMRYKRGAYYGLARALAEANIPYDIVFGGDGHYLEDKLTADTLKPYSKIVVPSLLEVTANQRRVVTDFVQGGGKALLFDKGGLHLDQDSENVTLVPEVELGGTKHDAADAYFRTNDAAHREMLSAAVSNLGCRRMYVSAPGVSVYPAYQPSAGRFVLHVVNYNHDRDTDKVTDYEHVEAEIPLPEGVAPGTIACRLLSPDREEATEFSAKVENGLLKLPLGPLHVYNLIIVDLNSAR